MPKKETEDIKSDERIISLRVSENVAKSISYATSLLPRNRNTVEPVDLLLAISITEGRGEATLRALAVNKHSQLIRDLENINTRIISGSVAGRISLQLGEVSYSPRLSSLLEKAQFIAGSEVVGTDHIILAELSQSGSILNHILKEYNVPEPALLARKISSRIVYKEKGNIGIRELKVYDVDYETINLLPDEALPYQLESELLQLQSASDYLQNAHEGKYTDILIRPKWTTEVLHSLETQPVTLIVTEQHDEAESIIKDLANQLVQDTGGIFKYKSIVGINPVALETDRERSVIEALELASDGVLYLPNLHKYLNIPNLRVALASEKVKIITFLSEKELGKALTEEYLQGVKPIYLDPPSIKDTIKILTAKKETFERVFKAGEINIEITQDAIETAAKLADRYYRQILPPGGAKALIARAATLAKIRISNMKELHDERVEPDEVINQKDVELALEVLTGISYSPEDPEKYLRMEEKLEEKVVGQHEAIEILSDSVRRAQAGLKDKKRPIGSFIFMGASGVGKTELARALSSFLFDDDEAMVRVDMSEYQEKHSISRLIGAPPGYVGYEEGGQLTEPVRKKPYSVVVFDEIEKAHPEVWNVLLQIMDDGRLTDGQGRTVDFKNTVIIMTGNIGSEFFRVEPDLGREKVVAAVREEIRDTFRPEFLNRVDETIIFNTLKPEDIQKIVDIQMRRVSKDLSERSITLELKDDVKAHLASEGYNPEYGARPLKRAIRKYIETPMSKKILSGEFTDSDEIIADMEDGKVVFKKKENNAIDL